MRINGTGCICDRKMGIKLQKNHQGKEGYGESRKSSRKVVLRKKLSECFGPFACEALNFGQKDRLLCDACCAQGNRICIFCVYKQDCIKEIFSSIISFS